ncbi:hypothetical protein C8R46DRAFT_1325248 [Mycena filopes]|nr:hypothetical protein C8R46DRAFT_1325248 [Mycena filopes]
MSNIGRAPAAYRLEYARSGRSKCKGTFIANGALRLGTLVTILEDTYFHWRHWGCVTPKVISNMKAIFNEGSEIDGFAQLNEDDRARVVKAWEDNKVANVDIPDSARRGDETDDYRLGTEGAPAPKKKKAARKRKADSSDDEDSDYDGYEEDYRPPHKKQRVEANAGYNNEYEWAFGNELYPGQTMRAPKNADTEVQGGRQMEYRVEYALSNRSKCRDGLCGGTLISKGELRFGLASSSASQPVYSWRHLECLTADEISNAKNSYAEPSALNGFGGLDEEDQARILEVWGHVVDAEMVKEEVKEEELGTLKMEVKEEELEAEVKAEEPAAEVKVEVKAEAKEESM